MLLKGIPIQVALLLATVTVCLGETKVDLGDTSKYLGDAKSPSLKDNTLWVSASDSRGYDFVPSEDLGGKIADVVKKDCKATVNNACYKKLRGLLDGAVVEFNTGISRREQSDAIAKRFVGVVGAIGSIAALFLAVEIRLINENKNLKVVKLHVDPVEASPIADALAGTDTVALSADGKALGSFSPKPSGGNNGVKVSARKLGKDEKGHKRGDVIISMPKDFASGVQEIISRMTNCELSGKLSTRSLGRGEKAKRAGDLGAAICGGLGVAIQAGGPLAPLLDVPRVRMPFGPGDVGRAFGVLQGAVAEYAPALKISGDAATGLAEIAFALAYEAIVNGATLGAEIPVSRDILKGSDSGGGGGGSCSAGMTKSTSRTGPCTARCEEIGMMEFCQTACPAKTTCVTTGAAMPPTPTAKQLEIVTTTTKDWEWIPMQTFGPPAPKANSNVDCLVQQLTIPPKIIPTLVDKFCKDKSLDKSSMKAFKASDAGDLKGFDEYDFVFQWTKGGKNKCKKSCKETFGELGQCSGGPSYIYARAEGSHDCGMASYDIHKKASKVSKRVCYPPYKHLPASESTQSKVAGRCPNVEMKFDSEDQFWEGPTAFGASGYKRYRYRISWIQGCGAFESQNTRGPLGADKDESCEDIMIENWKSCNNGGGGGYIDYGCLRYDFYMTANRPSLFPKPAGS